MLNKEGSRELAYVVIIDDIQPIVGSDNCECAVVGGWHIMVRKNQFNIGDPAIYFEIDSKVNPEIEAFSFLEKRNYKIKTQKYTFGGKGNFISQGLLMHASDFGWEVGWDTDDSNGNVPYIIDNKGEHHYANGESRFLTKELGVTYADAEDNQRKAPSIDKFKKMTQRHPEIFKQNWARWMMKRNWGKKVMFLFFGRKKDSKNGWPSWVQRTDEERIQNMPFILSDPGAWIMTEKIDGTSTSFTMKRGSRFKKNKMYVCSRNVCFDSIEHPCYYDSNVYWEMAQKYDIFYVLDDFLSTHPYIDWVTIQGETFGAGIQKRDYSTVTHDFMAFNLITSDRGRWNSVEMKHLLEDKYSVPCVPILDEHFKFNGMNVDDLLAYAEGVSIVDGFPREGLVFRSEDGVKSFKAVSNSYLLKYHS